MVVQLVLRTIREHITGEQRSAFEAGELQKLLRSYIPSLQQDSLRDVVKQVGTVVEASIMLVWLHLVSADFIVGEGFCHLSACLMKLHMNKRAAENG